MADARTMVEAGLPQSLRSLALRDSCIGVERTQAAHLLKERFGDRVRLD